MEINLCSGCGHQGSCHMTIPRHCIEGKVLSSVTACTECECLLFQKMRPTMDPAADPVEEKVRLYEAGD